METKQRAPWKSALKVVGYIAIAILVLIYWNIGIPALVAWYLFRKKKNKFSQKANIIVTASTLAVFLLIGFAHGVANRAPVLTIIEPKDLSSFQLATTTITGQVKPASSVVTINGIAVQPDSKGNFSYEAKLRRESNTYTVSATNGGNTQEQKLTINRIFTEQELAQIEQAKKDAIAQAEKEKAGKIIERLQLELNSFKKPFDNSSYRDSLVALSLEANMFGGWAQFINEGKSSTDATAKAMANELEQKVSALQVSEFPKMRSAYADLVGKTVWEDNITVQVLGGSNKTIELVGGAFANNKNIAKVQGQLLDSFKLFRFTRVNYKWYKYDEDYTYFSIESLPDSKVVANGQ